MSGSIDLGLVPAFVEVVRQGSFTAAALVLELPKSTVSRRVSRLERELGTQLLVRTTRALRLTEAGEVFFGKVACILEEVEEAARAVGQHQEEPTGTLRITAPHDISYDTLSVLLPRFCELHPQLKVEISLSEQVTDLVAEGFDVGVRGGFLRDSTLVARKIDDDELRLYASPRYLDEAGMPSSIADLTSHRCVLFRARNGKARWRLEGEGGAQTIEVTGTMATDDFGFVRRLVEGGGGIGLMPTATDFGDSLRPVLPDVRGGGGSIYVVYPGGRHVPAKVRVFRDYLLEHFRDHRDAR